MDHIGGEQPGEFRLLGFAGRLPIAAECEAGDRRHVEAGIEEGAEPFFSVLLGIRRRENLDRPRTEIGDEAGRIAGGARLTGHQEQHCYEKRENARH